MSSQAEYWNDIGGPMWAEGQVQLDAQLRPCGQLALAAARIERGEAVLDIGCGCGDTTAEIAELVGPSGRVVGLDVSVPMLARARERMTGRQVELVLGDAATAPLPARVFDVLFSRLGVMFFEAPVAALDHLRTMAKVGGRVAFVVWQPLEHNLWVKVPARAIADLVEFTQLGGPGEPGPFSMSDGDRLEQTLRAGGYTDVALDGEQLDLALGGGLPAHAAAVFAVDHGPLRRVLATAPDELRAACAARIAGALRDFDTPEGVRLPAAVWVVTARAT